MKTQRHWLAVAFATAIAALTAGPFLAQQSSSSPKDEVALRAAIEKETIQGNLPGAIESYKQLAQSKDRSVAARALLRMAESYQKMGDTESRRIYERIVRDYEDQKEMAATARARLGQPASDSMTSRDRVVFAGGTLFGNGDVSPDGRYMTDVDYLWTGNLVLHDLVTGKDRALTANKDWSDGNTAAWSTFSPDGKRIAYGWRSSVDQASELRIMTLEGSGLPTSRRLVTAFKEVRYYDPLDWSLDGKWLAAMISLEDLTKQIAIINVSTGEVRVLKTLGWRGPQRLFFSPDGKYLAYSLPANDDVAQRDIFVMTVDGSDENPVVQNDAFDVVMGWSPSGRHLIFGSDRTGSMSLWALPLTDGRAHAAPFLLKPNIGMAEAIGMTPSGSLFITRDTSTVGLHVAPIDLNTGKLTAPPVLQSFRSQYPEWSPDGKYLSYVYTGKLARGTLLAIRTMESGTVRELQSTLQYIRRAIWTPDSKSFIVNGRDFKGRLGIFQVSADTGATTVISADTSLLQRSPEGKAAYFVRGGELVEYDLTSGVTRALFRLPYPTWSLSPDGRSVVAVGPDNTTKTSRMLLFTLPGGEQREVFRVNAPEEFRPYTEISWTPDGRSVLVVKTRERDEVKELWMVPVYGGSPRKLDIDISGWLVSNGLRLHPDGRQIAFFTGKSGQEAWVYENVAKELKP